MLTKTWSRAALAALAALALISGCASARHDRGLAAQPELAVRSSSAPFFNSYPNPCGSLSISTSTYTPGSPVTVSIQPNRADLQVASVKLLWAVGDVSTALSEYGVTTLPKGQALVSPSFVGPFTLLPASGNSSVQVWTAQVPAGTPATTGLGFIVSATSPEPGCLGALRDSGLISSN